MSEPTAEQPQVTATVSPAAPPRSRWSSIPHHLGRARTSTVVLSLLFLGIGALWLNIRPDPERTVPASGGGTVVEQPVAPVPVVPTTPVPTTEAPTTSAEPTPTTEPPATTSTEVPTPEETTTTTEVPTTTEPSVPLPDTTTSPTG